MSDQIVLGVLGVVGLVVFLAVLRGMRGNRTLPDEPAQPRPRDLRAQPRWLQRIKAQTGGYFWLPCSMCGEEYGGHEWGGTLMVSRDRGAMVCANCAEEAQRRNRARSDWVEPDAVFHIGIRPR